MSKLLEHISLFLILLFAILRLLSNVFSAVFLSGTICWWLNAFGLIFLVLLVESFREYFD